MRPGSKCFPARSTTAAPGGSAPAPTRSIRSPRINTSASTIRPSFTSRALISASVLMGGSSGAVRREPIRRSHELGRVARLVGRVAGVAHHAKVRLGPALVELPSGLRRTDDVVAALDDHCRNRANEVDAAQQLVLALEEASVDEVVRLDARERKRELGRAELARALRIRPQRARGAFPDRPRARRLQLLARVGADQAAVIGGEQIAALVLGDRREKLLPELREQPARATLVEPFELPAA